STTASEAERGQPRGTPHCSPDRLSGCFTNYHGAASLPKNRGLKEEVCELNFDFEKQGSSGSERYFPNMMMGPKSFGKFALLLMILLIPNVCSLTLFGLFSRPNDHSAEDETAHPDGDHDFLGGIVKGIGDVTMGVRSAAEKVIDGVRMTIDGAIYDISEAFGAISSKLNPTIFPGTNWCGAGDRARGYDDFGIFGTADHCCRAHDSCPDNIPPGETVNGLRNDGQFTLSHCDCDDSFYWCLKNSSSLIAKKIGVTFFNIIRTRCFKFDYPLKCADDTSGEHCDKYLPDISVSKIWQWLDPKHF
ncbi:hypothetical protein J437_LFUL013307, partial [Ladona fulva]